MPAIKAIQQGTNADLIATAQALYPMNGAVLDLTPGTKQGFWTKHRPESLLLLPADTDFRAVPWPTDHFDHITFDPPYVTKGGHKTSTIDDMNERYGMLHVEKDPMAQWRRQIVPGMREAHRLLKPGGLLWWKMQDYVTSGKIWWFTKMALQELAWTADGFDGEIVGGFDLVDEFILDGHPGPQPLTDKCKECAGEGTKSLSGMPGMLHCPACNGTGKVSRRQVHARRAHSVLMVCKKKPTRRSKP